jgi:catechol 2,3-dioxygenase-like lactoylglutathione lyase family enzyme
MTKEIKTSHVALQYSDREKAEIFFKKILLLALKKTFTLSKKLSKDIFEINKDVIVDVYSNNDAYFEVFITKTKTKYNYEHICIEVDDIEDFVKRCKNYKIEPKYIKKGNKELIFVRDFSGNLYEIKGKQT